MTKNELRPKVSIGMPVYNGARYLREAISSILSQTYADLELIICDNASNDDTAAICQEYLDRDCRIRHLRNTRNLGASINYNTVFHRAKGDYFKWASCNDSIHPEYIARCVDILEREPSVVLVYPKTCLVNFDGDPIEYYDDGLNLQDDSPVERYCRLMHSIRLNNAMNGLIRSVALRRTALHGIFLASDITFIAELSLYGKFLELPDYLFFRRMTPEAVFRNENPAELLKHYDPRRVTRRIFPHWRRNWEHLAAVYRSEVPLRDKLTLSLFLCRWMYWEKKPLIAELQENPLGFHWPSGEAIRDSMSKSKVAVDLTDNLR